MYKVDIVNSGDSVFKVRSKEYEFAIDTKGKGVTPPDALLASLGSCLGVYIRKYADGAQLGIKDFAITVEGDFCKETPAYFKNINVVIDFKGVKVDERRQKAFYDFIMNCPVHNTLKNNPHVEIRMV